ncbi:MAG: cadherin domain-containing protein [Sterolibacteriaceae bacterium]|nr:cadherin domain-containing protein [Candidatus Methylophosphatis haderslevensis]
MWATLRVIASYTDGQGTPESVASADTSAVSNVNDAPTGSVTIDDTTPTQGQTLTASNSLADADGMGTVSYQWQRGGVDIAGATGATYTTTQTDVGATLRVIASYTDGQGTAESVASAATAAVANANDAPVGLPTIGGTPAEDQTLSADVSGISDGDGLGTMSYQWTRDGSAIGGATASTYTLGDADVGANLRVVVSYTDGGGTLETLTSAPVGPVANVNDAPTGSVTIDDTTPTQGQTLTASNTLADADGLGTISYQWQRAGVDIAGATGATYTTTQTDVGATLRVIASYTDGQGTPESVASADTSAVTNVNDPPILTGTGGALTCTENDPATAVDGGLTVSDVDSPTLAGATIQITSNYANGEDVLNFVNQLGISGNWNAGTGTLTVSGSATLADYQTALRSVGYSNASDSPSLLTRTVSFSVSDGAASSPSVVRNINLVAVNDAPAIAANTGLTVSEGSLGNVISTAMLNEGDPDDAGAGLSYTVTANVAHGTLRLNGVMLNANDSFTQADIDAGRVSYDHDGSETTGDSFGFRLADGAEDGAGTISGTFTITVTPQNGAPTITSNGGGNSAAISIAENGGAVTVVTATDPDLPPDALSYSIFGGADAARFAIDANTGALTFVAAPDFENPTDAGLENVYDVVVQVSDGSLVDSQTIAVTVTNVGESSVGFISDASPTVNEVAENAVAGTLVGITAQAADPDAMDSVTYSLDNDAGGRFAIDAASGVVSVAGPIDREAAASYAIVVRATSSDASFSTAGFTIGVLPVNEFAPAISSDGGGATAAIAVANNRSAVTTVTASDADLPAQSLTYSIAGGADASRFVIDVGTGALRFVAPPSHATPTDSNADNIYQVIVSVSDGTFSDTQAIDVTVQPPGNTPPVITSNGGGASASITVAENTTAVTTVTGSDTDTPAQTLAYSIAGGADAAKFAIDGATGVLSFVTAPDYEAPTDAGGDNIYDVVVQVSDGSLSDSQAISVAVGNVAEGTPGILVTPVAGLTTSEAGGSAQFSVVLTSAPTANVRIGLSVSDDTEGAVMIGTLEFDATNWNVAHIVTVVGVDDAAVDGDVAYSVIVAPATSADAAYNGLDGADVALVNRDNDVANTAPVITSDGGGVRATIGVNENSTAVTTVRATDTDVPAQTISYSIAGGADAAKFSIDARTGALSFLDAPDFEMPADAGADNQYDVTVAASDGQGGSDTQDIRVAVGDVREAPVLDLPSGTGLYVENAEPLAIAPDALLGNPDASGFGGGRLVVSISLNGEAGDRLAIANQGIGAGQIGVSGSSVTFGGEVIGTWSGGADGASGSTPLVVAFNAKASSAAVQAVARSVTFETVSEAPSVLARSVDLVVENSGGLASKGASVAVSVQPVDDAPVMQTATLHLRFGETVTLGTANVLGSDVDSASASLRFTVSGVTNGWFEATARPGAAISSFSLDELQSGGVRFVHSGKGMAPTFQVAISDGDSSSKPMLAAVTFEGPLIPGGGGTDSGGGSGSGGSGSGGSGSGGSGSGGTGTGGTDSGGGGKGTTPATPVSPTPATSPAEKPAAQPAVSGGAETPLFNPLVEAPASGVRGNGLDQVLSASVQMPAIEPGATAVARVTLIDTERQSAILISEGLNNGDFDLRLVSVAQAAAPAREAPLQAIEVEPAPVEQVAPEVVVNEITVSAAEAVGLSLTVGMVWWALRLGGLLASAMVSVPAWRQIDLLPILDDQGDRDWDGDDDLDGGSDDQAAEEVFATSTGGREP